MKIKKILLALILSIPLISAAAVPSLGSEGLKMILNVGYALLGVCGLLGLYFLTKFWRKNRNRKKQFKIFAIIFNRDGTWFNDKLGKFLDKDKIDKMIFQTSGETMPVIDPENIRAYQVCLWRYAPSQYAVIPPRLWGRNPKDFKIEVIDYQMKNFAYLEQRAAISRWQKMMSLIQQWAPYITILLLLILTGVAIWFITKMNNTQYAQIVAARVQECRSLISSSTNIIPKI